MCKTVRCMVSILGPRNQGAARVVVGVLVVDEARMYSGCGVCVWVYVRVYSYAKQL